MKLRRNLFYRMGISATLLMVVALLLVGIVFWQFILRVEDTHASNKVAQLTRLVDSRIGNLREKAADWGTWDDSYGYFVGDVPNFLEREVTLAWFENAKIDFISFVRVADGQSVTMAVDQGGAAFDDELAASFDAVLPRLWSDLSAGASRGGLVELPDLGPAMFAAQGVTRSDGSGDGVGIVVFGQLLDEGVISQLSQESTTTVWGERWDSLATSSLTAADRQSLTSGRPFVLKRPNLRQMRGYVLLRDFAGLPTYVLSFEDYRIEFIGGLWLIGILGAALLLLMLLFQIIVTRSMKRLAIEPLERLAVAARIVRSGRKLQVSETSSDEFAVLSSELNRTMARLDADRERAEAMAADLRKYQMAVEGATDMIVIADADLNVIYANPATAKVHGYFGDEAIGLNALDLWTSGDGKFAERIRRAVLEERRQFSGEAIGIRGDGARYDAELRLSPILDVSGQLRYVVGLTRDVTKIKEIDRMKSEFVSVASHQLKTPLTGIRWFSEMLLADDSKLTPEQKEALQGIYEVNDRLIRLVNDLLNVSRIDSGRKFSVKKSTVELLTIIRQAAIEQGIIASKRGVTVEVDDAAPAEITVDVDAEKISQVIHNLINNAVKYSAEGGQVTVGVAVGPDDVMVSVSDRGLGIPVAEQSRLFNKFFRASNVGMVEGTGLGLYIARAIVEGHGGKLTFESEEGRGTTFRFTVPL